MIKFIFSIIAEENTERATEELARFFNGKHPYFDTVVIETDVDEGSYLVVELLDEESRNSDLDEIFYKFGIVVKGIRIENTSFLDTKYNESSFRRIKEARQTTFESK